VQADTIRRAIVAGDLERARDAGRSLVARLPLTGLPARLDSHQAALRSAAAAVVQAPDLAAAAAASSELGLACGACHGSMKLQGPPAGDMPNGDEWEAAMARHAWAADEMWTAIVWMAPDRFARAVESWNATPLVRPHTHDEKRFTSEALALEDRVHDLAERAAATPNAHERAALYGSVIATCSECHGLVRRR
jgi:cytochrome c553